jgi:putative transposase
MPQSASIRSLPQALRIIKEMELKGYEWGENYRDAGRRGIREFLECQMRNQIDSYLEEMARIGEYDRRNGHFSRHLLTELGDIELHIPRTRRYSAVKVIQAYARRTANVDRMILACFVLGLSTRKVGRALLPVLGEPVSPASVSRIAKTLDQAVAAFHRRALEDIYPVLIFDGVVLARKTGMGAIRRPVLVALGIRKDGRKEILDFRLVPGESALAWETFLTDLFQRGLFGSKLQLIGADGGKGLNAALSLVYPNIPVQLCWAHKSRNLLAYVRKKDKEAVKADLHRISYADYIIEARSAAREFLENWRTIYPKAVACLQKDLEDLLQFYLFDDVAWRVATRTTNAIERSFREVRRRTRPMGVFSDRTSVERILYAVFAYENMNARTCAPFLLTQKS